MPPFGSTPSARNCGLREKIVTCGPAARTAGGGASRGGAAAALPQRKMLVVIDRGAPVRRNLGEAVGLHRADEAHVLGKRRVDVLVKHLRDRGHCLALIGSSCTGHGDSSSSVRRLVSMPIVHMMVAPNSDTTANIAKTMAMLSYWASSQPTIDGAMKLPRRLRL